MTSIFFRDDDNQSCCNIFCVIALLVLSSAAGCASTAVNPQASPEAAKAVANPVAPKAAESLRPTPRPVNLAATGYAVISVQGHKSAAQQRLLEIGRAHV